jgi:hypothetical protein
VIVDSYRDHRIEVNAVRADDRWNAEVRIRHMSGGGAKLSTRSGCTTAARRTRAECKTRETTDQEQ